MGVRARRWQLWLITTFILTGIIGMITLFKAPESAGAVTIAGGAANQSVALPSRSVSEQATQLPAWTPTDDAATSAKPSDSESRTNSIPKVAAATTRPTTVAVATTPAVATTSRTQATQLPSTTVTKATTTAATKATSIAAKTITPPPAPTTAAPTTTKPTTAAPVTTTTKPVTTAKPTTPAPIKTTTATTSRTRTYPTRCFRIFFWTFCR